MPPTRSSAMLTLGGGALAATGVSSARAARGRTAMAANATRRVVAERSAGLTREGQREVLGMLANVHASCRTGKAFGCTGARGDLTPVRDRRVAPLCTVRHSPSPPVTV